MLAMSKKISDSRKFGPTQLVLKMMEHDQKLGYVWNVFIDDQKNNAEQINNSSKLFVLISEEISKQLLQSNELLNNETMKIKDTITNLNTNIYEVEELEKKIKFIQSIVSNNNKSD